MLLADGRRLIIGQWRDGSESYRAAYIQTADGQGEIVLTGPEDASRSDAELTTLARAEYERGGGEPMPPEA